MTAATSKPRIQFSIAAMLRVLAVVGYSFGFVKAVGTASHVFVGWGVGCVAAMQLRRFAKGEGVADAGAFVISAAAGGVLGTFLGVQVVDALARPANGLSAGSQILTPPEVGLVFAFWGAIGGAMIGTAGWANAAAIIRRGTAPPIKENSRRLSKCCQAANAGTVLILFLSLLALLIHIVYR